MTISDTERVLEAWAMAWSSHDTEKLLSLFTDDCVYEDVTFGAINHGKEELRAFADGDFARTPAINTRQGLVPNPFALTNLNIADFAARRIMTTQNQKPHQSCAKSAPHFVNFGHE
jgi:uncharacterized protein (TIGR02246 family)